MKVAMIRPHKEGLYPTVQEIVDPIAAEYGCEVVYAKRPVPDELLGLPTLLTGADKKYPDTVGTPTLTQGQIMSKGAVLTELRAYFNIIKNGAISTDFKHTVFEGDDVVPFDKLKQVLVVDIETGGDIKTMLPEEMWLLSCALYDGETLFVLGETWLQKKSNVDKLYAALTAPNRKLVAHNMKFDFRSLTALLDRPLYGHLDTQLLHHAINPAGTHHDLKNLAKMYLGAHDWDAGSKQYVKGEYKEYPGGTYPEKLYIKYRAKLGKVKRGFECIPREVLYEYNAYDVYYTWHLMQHLFGMANEQNHKAAKLEYQIANFFQDTEDYGVFINLEQLNLLEEQYTDKREELMGQLAELVSPEFNPNSPKQVKEVFNSIGVQIPDTSEATLTDLLATPIPETAKKFVSLLLEIRGVTKVLNTYIHGIRVRLHSGKVFPNYLVHGTASGRMSASNPNIQNIPRDKALRKLFTVRDTTAYDFVEVDYSQAELRTMAVLSGDDYLISLFQDGMPDFFDSLLPVTFPDADISSWTPQEKKDNRAKLKSVVYGLSYGRKAPAIAHALGITTKQAQEIIDNYFAAAPKFYDWREEVIATVLDPDKKLETIFGRHYQAEVITHRNRNNVINSGLSFLPQSTASDICINAARATSLWVNKEYGAHIVGSVHDAILLEIPKEHTIEVARRVQKEMAQSAVNALGATVPFATEAEKGETWGAMEVF